MVTSKLTTSIDTSFSSIMDLADLAACEGAVTSSLNVLYETEYDVTIRDEFTIS